MLPARVTPHWIYPIVAELDPGVPPEPTLFVDWSELAPETRPRPVLADDLGRSRPLDPRGLPDGAFFVGTGEKLLGHMDHVLRFAQEAVFRFEDEEAWAWQRRELESLAAQFIGPFRKRPCIVRVHQFTWTRSFVHRAIFPGDVSA